MKNDIDMPWAVAAEPGCLLPGVPTQLDNATVGGVLSMMKTSSLSRLVAASNTNTNNNAAAATVMSANNNNNQNANLCQKKSNNNNNNNAAAVNNYPYGDAIAATTALHQRQQQQMPELEILPTAVTTTAFPNNNNNNDIAHGNATNMSQEEDVANSSYGTAHEITTNANSNNSRCGRIQSSGAATTATADAAAIVTPPFVFPLAVTAALGDDPVPLPHSYRIKRHDVICESQGVRDRVGLYPGNERFRTIIELRLGRYQQAQTRLEKMHVLREIVNAVYHAGGNFIRRRKQQQDNPRSGKRSGAVHPQQQEEEEEGWTEIGEYKAREKAGHALRKYLTKRNQGGMAHLLPCSRIPSTTDSSTAADAAVVVHTKSTACSTATNTNTATNSCTKRLPPASLLVSTKAGSCSTTHNGCSMLSSSAPTINPDSTTPNTVHPADDAVGHENEGDDQHHPQLEIQRMEDYHHKQQQQQGVFPRDSLILPPLKRRKTTPGTDEPMVTNNPLASSETLPPWHGPRIDSGEENIDVYDEHNLLWKNGLLASADASRLPFPTADFPIPNNKQQQKHQPTMTRCVATGLSQTTTPSLLQIEQHQQQLMEEAVLWHQRMNGVNGSSDVVVMHESGTRHPQQQQYLHQVQRPHHMQQLYHPHPHVHHPYQMQQSQQFPFWRGTRNDSAMSSTTTDFLGGTLAPRNPTAPPPPRHAALQSRYPPPVLMPPTVSLVVGHNHHNSSGMLLMPILNPAASQMPIANISEAAAAAAAPNNNNKTVGGSRGARGNKNHGEDDREAGRSSRTMTTTTTITTTENNDGERTTTIQVKHRHKPSASPSPSQSSSSSSSAPGVSVIAPTAPSQLSPSVSWGDWQSSHPLPTLKGRTSSSGFSFSSHSNRPPQPLQSSASSCLPPPLPLHHWASSSGGSFKMQPPPPSLDCTTSLGLLADAAARNDDSLQRRQSSTSINWLDLDEDEAMLGSVLLQLKQQPIPPKASRQPRLDDDEHDEEGSFGTSKSDFARTMAFMGQKHTK